MRLALLLLFPCIGIGSLSAQGAGFQVGHLFTDPPATSYRLGVTAALLGPVGGGLNVVVMDGHAPMGSLWGAGADLSLFRSGAPGVYLLGGVQGGLASGGSDTFWGSWSAGLGYELFPLHGLSLAGEGRYRSISSGKYHGVELGFRLGLDRGSRRSSGGGSPSRSSTTEPAGGAVPAASEVRADLGRSGVSEDRAALISGVVQTALDVMGMPYRWGDEGADGFDCSGLIRYAFGRHGVTLPRRSVDQAREGAEVGRDLDALRAGDVLTFATSGKQISHVGLYLGNGKFIHSARQGVQISVLSPDDLSGRWWFDRWVGARRIVG
jgi:cell wall-associated NlpC family hydrolase